MAKNKSGGGGNEANEVKAIMTAAKKGDHNFALFRGDTGFVFKAHKTKSMSAMRKAAKDDGATPKGAVGVLKVEGKTAYLTVEDPDSTPANFAKAFRKHLNTLKIKMQVVLKAANGDVIDAASDETDGEATDLSTDSEDVLAKIVVAFEAYKPTLTSSLPNAPDGLKAKIKQAIVFFQKAVSAKSPAKAKQALDAIKTLVSTISDTGAIASNVAAAVDPAKLAALSPKITEWETKATGDPTFLRSAYGQMSKLRGALKSSIALIPPPPNIDELRVMKAKMDDLFYANVDQPPAAHGPECHGPGLTMDNQRDRIEKKVNPRTGAKAKNKVKSASNFTDKASYVEAELYARERALAKITSDGIVPPPKGGRPERLVIEATLLDVLGPDWAKSVQGVERFNLDKAGQVVGSVWEAGSTCKAIYDLLDDGSLRLVTLYPNPKTRAPAPIGATPPPVPAPAPAPTKPAPKRKRRKRNNRRNRSAQGKTT
ncbi:MAG: hypothetical protein ABJ263_14295 [Tateyamaria sp.]|uniref:hypothetical protein n=1 Tax=Tateyamaria sp. TaxID=1929288 RepID=UPI00327A442B